MAEEFRTEMEALPFSFSVWDGVGNGLPQCYRQAMTFLQVCQGECTLFYGCDSLKVTEGEVIYVPAGTVFRVQSEGKVDCVLRQFSFESASMVAGLGKSDRQIYAMFEAQTGLSVVCFDEENTLRVPLSETLDMIEGEWRTKESCYQLTLSAAAYRILALLLRQYLYAENAKGQELYHNVLRLSPVLAELCAHPAQKYTLKDLADKVLLTPDHFGRLFLRCMGKTPFSYITALRINCAMQLLMRTEELSLSDIAMQCGFSGNAHINRVFRENLQMSPVAFRALCFPVEEEALIEDAVPTAEQGIPDVNSENETEPAEQSADLQA